MTPWFSIRAHADIADVEITGEIRAGDGDRFIAALPSSSVRTIRLAVSSLGGDVTSALQVAHALKGHRARVEATICKIAASAATLPICAADRVRIGADALVMLHNPEVVPDDKAPRDARALRSAAGELDRMRDQMIACYAWRLRSDRARIVNLLDATTWWDAADAVKSGLADEVSSAAPAIAARFDPSALAALGTVPHRFRASVAALGPSAPFSAAEVYARRNGHTAIDVSEIYRRRNRGATR